MKSNRMKQRAEWQRIVSQAKERVDQWRKDFKFSFENGEDQMEKGWKKAMGQEAIEAQLHLKRTVNFKLTDRKKGSGRKYTFKSFHRNCSDGGFIDYDGYGRYATADKISDIIIEPSDITTGIFRWDFSHIIWFNR